VDLIFSQKPNGELTMSNDGMHVHGPHDHALEHASAHGAQDSFSGRVAVLTAILATVGAMMSYEGGATQAEAMLLKNEAAIKKTEASNQWNYYQAKGQKQNLADLGAALSTSDDRIAKFTDQSKRYESEKANIKEKAQSFEDASQKADHESEHSMHEHHRWAQATTLIQVAIALSAIALLTRKKWLLWGVLAMGGSSIGIGVITLLGISM
jgi:hypothetical protein